MYINTNKIAKPNDHIPEVILSAPNVGPTVLSSTIFAGAGKEPAFNNPAKSLAASIVKLPVIIDLDPNFSLGAGAENTKLSIVTATGFPIFFPVNSPHFSAP